MNKSFAEYLNLYFTEYLTNQLNASSETIKTYKQVFKSLINYITNIKEIEIRKLNFDIITKELILDYLHYLEDNKHNSIKTRNLHLAVIKSFYQYIKLDNPTLVLNIQNILNIRTKKTSSKLREYLTIDEVDKLLSSINTKTRKGRRDLVLLSVLYDSAVRVSELINIKLMDLRLDNNPTLIVLGKGRKYRTIPLMENTKNLLIQYINENKFLNTSYLFSNAKGEILNVRTIQLMLNKYLKLSNCDKHISPHSIRRTRAIHLLEAGINVVIIKDILGHASITTTDIYVKDCEELKRKAIKEAYSNVFDNVEVTSWNKDENLLNKLLSL